MHTYYAGPFQELTYKGDHAKKGTRSLYVTCDYALHMSQDVSCAKLVLELRSVLCTYVNSLLVLQNVARARQSDSSLFPLDMKPV